MKLIFMALLLGFSIRGFADGLQAVGVRIPGPYHGAMVEELLTIVGSDHNGQPTLIETQDGQLLPISHFGYVRPVLRQTSMLNPSSDTAGEILEKSPRVEGDNAFKSVPMQLSEAKPADAAS